MELDIKTKLIEQGFSDIEAQLYMASYNIEAEQMYSEINCEVI